jgi:cobaltochelatase CobT
MDSATALANDAHHHLAQFVAWCEAKGGIEIFGLGVGLDPSPFYQRPIAIDLKTTACCRQRLPRSCGW